MTEQLTHKELWVPTEMTNRYGRRKEVRKQDAWVFPKSQWSKVVPGENKT